MNTSLDRLLDSLDRLYRGPRPSYVIHRRNQLDLLIAATDADASAAVARHPVALADVLQESPRFWLSYLGERPGRWLSGALALLPEPLDPSHLRALLAALSCHRRAGPVPAVLERLLDDPAERARSAQLLASYRSEEAWAMLRRHDGPDLDLGLRLTAVLGEDPSAPLPGLAAFLGPGAARETRAAALAWLLARRDHGRLHAGVLPLVEGCLDDGVAPAVAIRLLFDHQDSGARRRLFDRLWAITQSGKPIWVDAGDLFFYGLVACAPAPELIAILLDTIDGRAFSRALVKAIGEHPDPYLVPALERWSQANPAQVTQKLVQPALAACRRVLV